MSEHTVESRDDERLSALGYRQELSRVLSLFDNFSVAFSYLSPMVGIYSLYILGLAAGGPRYIWTMPVVVGLMLLVALVFGELSSEYPLSGALYQYGKYNVGPRYGWFVGWIYGFALLATVASVDSGAVGYITDLSNIWFKTHLNAGDHLTIFVVTGAIIVLSGVLNSIGAKIMGRVARFGVYVETIGTFGVFIALAIHGFHQGFGFLFSSQGVENVATNPYGVNFGGHWLTGAALVAVLANVYIFYGFESAGDISEETVDAGRQVPKAMRNALLYGGIASFVLVLGLLLATPKSGIGGVVTGGIPSILAVLPGWLQDFFLVMVIIAFFSCGTAVQGAGARVAFALARDGAVPASKALRKVSATHKTPVNAIITGVIVPFLFLLLVLVNPSHNVHILWFDYPANINALYALVSFAVSGIYLSFFLTVLGAFIARRRGWVPNGSFTLGKWGMPVTIGAMAYLFLMLVNICWPSAITSGRALFNYGWVTLLVMLIIVVIGAVYEGLARPDREVSEHRIEKN
ncbi:MAG: amino acid permease [Acidobacteriota bacterium]|nr:amino acid permease [Acidobacteriota bacterium]